ncbi:MAG: diacylglycerol kinase family lipid kinase, partial [Dehalococcoidia bacterium]|nr:diacylglycerol kinase family lipid kinase [Dehalococcoidia bacterium]
MTTPYRRATFIVNPAARGIAKRLPEPLRAVRYLRKQGIETQLVVPESSADATDAARKSAERGDDLLFVAGGDGSVRDAALGLAGSSTALAAVPAGTVNIFAREVGLPRGIRAAIDAHLSGQRTRMDLGRVADTCFLLMASVGWDAEVVRRVNPSLKRRFGDLAYMFQTAITVPRLQPAPARWRTDETEYEDQLAVIVIANTRLYGGLVEFAPEAYADDGLLDMVALCPHTVLDGARLSARLAVSRLEGDARVVHQRGETVVVETPGLA